MAETKEAPKESALKTTDHDRVVMASRKADGTPDQTADFTYIGDKDIAIEASKVQLAQQAVSAVDVEHRGVSSSIGGTDLGNDPDPQVQKIIDAHKAAEKSAHAQAEKEVEARHEDVKASGKTKIGNQSSEK